MLIALFTPAFACGGFVPTAGTIAASDAQQALFELGADAVTVTYRARYTGDAADFAWVLAVPGVIGTVAEGDSDRLDAIEEASAPVVELDPAIGREPLCGCGMRSKGGDFANDTGGSGVDITGSGYVGDFEYTTLAASDADGLTQWLDDHGYDTTLIAAAIADYVADPLDYEFVAVQLRPDVPEAYAVNLDSLAITYGAAADGELHLIFPAKLGQSSTVDTVRTEIFVLATGWADIGGGWTGAANTEQYDVVGPDYEDPAGLYWSMLYSLGGTTLKAFPAYSGAYDGQWLTRWDSVTEPSANAADPVFTDSGDEQEVDTILYSQDEAAYERGDTPAWILPLGLLGLGIRLRRRRA